MRFISDKFGILDYSNQDVPIPRNDEVGRIQMKKNVVSAEDTLQKVKGTFAEKIGKIKKRCVVEGGEGGGGECTAVVLRAVSTGGFPSFLRARLRHLTNLHCSAKTDQKTPVETGK
jgi:hypothetical protein